MISNYCIISVDFIFFGGGWIFRWLVRNFRGVIEVFVFLFFIASSTDFRCSLPLIRGVFAILLLRLSRFCSILAITSLLSWRIAVNFKVHLFSIYTTFPWGHY